MTRNALATAVATLAFGAPASAQVPSDPSFHLLAQELYQRSQQRGVDQATNPDYLTRWAQLVPEFLTIEREQPRRASDTDPFRLDWGAARGEEIDVSIENRYGARLHAHVSLPLDRSLVPFPAVLMLTGSELPEQAYRGIAQGLAEAGYAVLGVNAQGDFGSQQHAPDPDASTAASEYCRDGGNFGGWQDPQEMGIVEQGPCAGEAPPPDETPEEFLRFFASHGAEREHVQRYYEAVKARKAFAALDAVEWLLSDDNPRRDLIDGERIGVVGHSLGGHAALLAGNGDPERRFDAVVSFDSLARLGNTATPRVPTMFQHADRHESGPHRQRPGPESLPGHLDARRFQAEGVPVAVVALAGSTHQEFNYLPTPVSQAPLLNASLDGERVALWYALAWLDRWLKPGRKSRDDATRRLLARSYDGTVDRSSIGQGPADPTTGRNMPPMVAGEKVDEHLSPLYRSSAHLDTTACPDLRTGCG